MDLVFCVPRWRREKKKKFQNVFIVSIADRFPFYVLVFFVARLNGKSRRAFYTQLWPLHFDMGIPFVCEYSGYVTVSQDQQLPISNSKHSHTQTQSQMFVFLSHFQPPPLKSFDSMNTKNKIKWRPPPPSIHRAIHF